MSGTSQFSSHYDDANRPQQALAARAINASARRLSGLSPLESRLFGVGYASPIRMGKSFEWLVELPISSRAQGLISGWLAHEVTARRERFPRAAKRSRAAAGGRIGNTDFLQIARKMGAVDALRKPFDPDDLLGRIDNCLKVA